MELTQAKPQQPYFGFYKILGNIGVPTLGVMLLVSLAHQLRRSGGAFDPLVVGVAALSIVIAGLSYYAFRRVLIDLGGRIDDKVLSRLLVAANSMVAGGYVSCMMVLIFLEHH